MNKDSSMPWDDQIKTDYQQGKERELSEGSSIGENTPIVYGLGKPKRTYIVGDITSDSNEM